MYCVALTCNEELSVMERGGGRGTRKPQLVFTLTIFSSKNIYEFHKKLSWVRVGVDARIAKI